MTRGRAATTEPFDISAVSRSDELFDALAARRLPEADDPAAGLLAALVADVDKDAPPLPAPARVPCGAPRRRGVRAVVTFGVAAVVLTSAGAAAAGGGNGGMGAMEPHGPGKTRSTERSNENIRHQQPATGFFVAGRRPVPKTSETDTPDDRSARHGTHKSDKTNKPPNKVAWGKAHGPTPEPSPSPTSPPAYGPVGGVHSPVVASPTPETS